MKVPQEKHIASEAKTNLKKFWIFTKGQTRTRARVSNLQSDNRKTETDKEKAEEVLLNQFSSVFTIESGGDVPTLSNIKVTQPIQHLSISVEDVKQLTNLDKSKTAGPDGIHSRVCWELREKVA